MKMKKIASVLGLVALGTMAVAHGDVTPQPVNTDALPDVGTEWLEENPYRAATAGEDVWKKAVEIGSSGFNQNCARCHGLEAISGGIAPDLRYLEADESGDSWFAERFQHGYTQNGVTKMPAFGPILGQKAGWAIRTYIETRPDQDSVDKYSDELKKIRDELDAWGKSPAKEDWKPVQARLAAIAGKIDTLSGAPVADSIAYRAANDLDGTDKSFTDAAEALTIGLSAAK